MSKELELQKIYCCNALDLMARMPDGFVDMTCTSPPYDSLRTYTQELTWTFDLFQAIARELYRVTKKGGVVVWVVGDATVNGSETGTSFRQALYFKEIGFNLHDTMIWRKTNPMPTDSRIPRYLQSFEYMFVFSSGTPICNQIRDKCLRVGVLASGNNNYPARRKNGNKSLERTISATTAVREDRVRPNVWDFPVHDVFEVEAREHPASYPSRLVKDHILSWSNENDLIYDCFMGSGTTAKVAHQLNRRWIGSEISSEYVALANKRLEPYLMQTQLF